MPAGGAPLLGARDQHAALDQAPDHPDGVEDPKGTLLDDVCQSVVAVEQAQQRHHLVGLHAGHGRPRFGGGDVDRVGRAEIARRVREVAQEPLAFVQDLLRGQRELAGLRQHSARDRHRGLFPEQHVVDRRQVLQRAHAGRHHLAVLEPDLRPPRPARQPEDTRARRRRHRAQQIEQAVVLRQQALGVVAVGAHLGDIDDVADVGRRAQEIDGAGGARLGLMRDIAQGQYRKRRHGAVRPQRGDDVQRRLSRLAQHHHRQRGRARPGELHGAAEVRGAGDLAPLALEAVSKRFESVQVRVDQKEARRLGHCKRRGSAGQYTAGSKETPKSRATG